MKAYRLVHGVFTWMLVLSATNAVAQDWPQWRGPERDGSVKKFTPPQEWPEELTLQWKQTVGDGCSTPALIGDRLFVFARQGEEEVARCLNAATGEELWKDSHPAERPTGGPARFPGPRCSCTVTDGKLITLGVAGTLSCLDATTGEVVWRKDPFPGVVPTFFTSASPIVVGGTVIAHLGGKGNGAIFAYDLETGDEKWRWAGEGPEYGSPVLLTVNDTLQIVTPTEQHYVGVRVSDGKLLWQYLFPPQSRAYNSVTPIVDGDTVFLSGARRGIRALKIKQENGTFSTEELWNNPDLASQYNTPVLRGGFLFGLSDRNRLYCVDAETGEATWTDGQAWGSRSFGAIVQTDSCLFLLSNDSELVVFQPDSKAFTPIATYIVAEGATVAHPIIAGTRIFIKDQDSIAMWSLK